jgi:hypothetical protein
VGQLGKEHGHELGPGAEALGVALGAVLEDEPLELVARDLTKDLTE